MPAAADPVFQRNKFLLRQKHFAINEKYYVGDEQGNSILFVERPAMLIRSCLAIAAAIAAFFIVIFAVVGLGGAIAKDQGMQIGVPVGFVLGFLAVAVVAGVLSPKRHVYFYRDDTKRELLMKVEQVQRLQIITARFTIMDASGATLATLKKNYIESWFVKRWHCNGPDGRDLFRVREDSIILALIRRFVAAFKTDFYFFQTGTDRIIGRFIRKWTILDRYVLDLGEDVDGFIDRRIGLAMGVMLDTGERR